MSEVNVTKFFRNTATILLVAVAYWGAARLSLLLVLQPGYATAVWPSAGIALGAALIWKTRGVAGAALGALAWNLTRLFHWPGVEDALPPIIQSMGVTVGVILQASAGAWMIRRAIGYPTALVRDHQVILFMVLGGPLSCVICATVGVSSLWMAGTLSTESVWFSWFTWWVGDSIGVLTIAPLILMFFGEPADLWRHRRWSIGFPTAVTFGVAVLAFVAASRSETRQELDRLDRRADAINSAFHTRVLNAANLLRACDGFYQSSVEVTRAEFTTFASSLLREGSGVMALSSIERVDDADRAAFEEKMRRAGLADFVISEVQDEARIVPATRRPVYYCLTSIEPFEENKLAIGVDVSSRSATARAIERAIATGDIVVTERVTLLQDPDHRFGVVTYLPRFARNAAIDTADQRREAFVGLCGAVVRLADLVGASTTRFDLQEVTLQLTDITDPGHPQLLYADARTPSAEPNDQVVRAIEIGGRRWQLRVARLHGYSLGHQSLQSWMVLAGGLILTSLLGGLLLILTGRATLIASLVRDRTRELSLTNIRLAEEQAVSRQIMRELETSRDAAEEADKTKSAFLANMSHEIRTPMTAILGYTDLLIDPYLTPQLRSSYAEVIRRNGEHLMEVVNDILDISKIEAGKLAVEMIPCSIDEIVRDVQNMMQPRAHQKGIEFSVEWKGDTSRHIRSDPIRVRQILINLVSNAIKFTERGGVKLRVERQFDYIDMSVSDTGIGMTAQQIQRVFEPFTQGDSTMTRRFGGTGLGLAISRHLSQLLGGELELRSELHKGSTFRLRLPAIDIPESERAVSSQPVPAVPFELPAAMRGKRILLAEDSNDVREFLRSLLVHAGLEVTTVYDGEQLLDAAMQARNGGGSYDLFLVDMQMPLLDGYEATRRIRAAGISVPIIAITAHTLESDRQACLDAGCTDYLRKPVRRNMLLQRIAAALGIDADGVESIRASQADPIHSELENDPIIADLLPVFFGEIDRYSKQLHQATQTQDAAVVRQILHNIKGAAATFGFPQLGEIAASASAEMRVRPWGEGFHAAMAEFYDLSCKVCPPTPPDRERDTA